VEEKMDTSQTGLQDLLENAVGGRLRERVRKLAKDVKQKDLSGPLQEAADAAKWFDDVELGSKDSDSPSYTALVKLEQARARLDEAIAAVRPGLETMQGGTFPSGENIVKEMRTLDAMFEHYRIVEAPGGEQVLIATTTDVELKDPEEHMWDFGKFEVIIDLNVFTADGRPEGSGRLLRINALTPNRCADKPELTHPHVNGTNMCTGTGEEEIKKAQKSSSVADLLEAVGGVLHRYNPRSPFHPLESWGTSYGSCVDCGNAVRREVEATFCTVCNAILCESCTHTCRGCTKPVCGGCGTKCEKCNKIYCGQDVCTLDGCRICGAQRCPSCLDDGLCEGCAQRQKALEAARERATKEDEPVEFSTILKRGPATGGKEDGKKSTDTKPGVGEGGFLDSN